MVAETPRWAGRLASLGSTSGNGPCANGAHELAATAAMPPAVGAWAPAGSV